MSRALPAALAITAALSGCGGAVSSQSPPAAADPSVGPFATPQPGEVVSDLRVGSNRSSERFFLFQPGVQR
jgi:hypothetical protein